ncbi:MAG: enoyl-CoA hydratase/isomerase family protein [Rhodospirillaceae bacterium]|nr:enoyl-CoA hydratase/isomerase family protein [Rhodospirillaceae bacterium]MBT3628822.1 enoyl-CoA hydratase/isomerase family protein [Rhodospirillaceae bacterium]MBT3928066.1 enoyl-CoA hydratase/isomerase family protein [Rhodospirillaceae bacterium]MBT5038310.1 enoyl-CoA hydratase/isomerase family protein [Rhodospirillaceae bacterium]MBT5675968.1 enoyl-CoA hydratase/isomerase family protein [Rhodospirillaceae bacterium]
MSQSFDSSLPELLKNLDGFRVEIDEARERADIILDRPPLNVVSMKAREQIAAIFEELDRNDAVRVIVLRGAGKNLSSGGEIPGFMEQTPEHVSRLAWNVAAAERCHKPVVAAIRGYCFGVGFELSLACDFRIVSADALVGLPEQRIGMIPGSGGSIRLLKMIGMARTKSMVMRSLRVSGTDAYAWGIATECVADDKLEEATDAFVDELRFFSPLAQRTIKGVLNAAEDAPLHVGIEMEGQAYGRIRSSEDFAEGVASFKEKRKAVFKGR